MFPFDCDFVLFSWRRQRGGQIPSIGHAAVGKQKQRLYKSASKQSDSAGEQSNFHKEQQVISSSATPALASLAARFDTETKENKEEEDLVP